MCAVWVSCRASRTHMPIQKHDPRCWQPHFHPCWIAATYHGPTSMSALQCDFMHPRRNNTAMNIRSDHMVSAIIDWLHQLGIRLPPCVQPALEGQRRAACAASPGQLVCVPPSAPGSTAAARIAVKDDQGDAVYQLRQTRISVCELAIMRRMGWLAAA